MLDSDTKRRIDSARDTLVGIVPDPKSQVEQITIALIYKFMEDMDNQAEEFGGKRKFFTGDFARYGWSKLLRSGLGGHETLNLYAEGILKMPENPGIPPLFRNIFKNAYLSYRNPETLKMFLKIIDEFDYDHSEKLGDAFEYLLSCLSSQGDAGQFRTPRHIIDFIVQILDPKKDETILDPACGTAGFLISAYKHIINSNKDTNGNSKLTPDETGRIIKNLAGYDISHDMVRLSLVNMYLHGFPNPRIEEYDTLTSQDKWNEHADVILANPPFMSPKGGIRPHNRFSVQSKRSEVLFVDYMAEHLTPTGRAGIIVPEGIIFQSQNAYKQLRKMLVDEYLVAVISLPAGVFNPYSGVKTSILILDKALAKKSDSISFVKIENDGFGLGAQRRKSGMDDLPDALNFLKSWLHSNQSIPKIPNCLIVEKEKIAANGDYNLSGERYREIETRSSRFPLVPLGKVARLINGRAYRREELLSEGTTPVLRVGNFFSNRGWYYSNLVLGEDKYCNKGDLLYAWSASFGPRIWEGPRAIFHYHIWKIETTNSINKHFLYYLLEAESKKIKSEGHGIAMIHTTKGAMEMRKFPIPPLAIQKEIVVEIDGYQKVIDGARTVLDNYRPHIQIDPEWEMVELGEVCIFKRGPFGGSLKKEIFVKSGYAVYEQSHAIANDFKEFRYFIDKHKFDEMHGFQVKSGELIMSCSGTMGKVAIIPDNAPHGIINQALLKLTPTDRIIGVFLKLWMESTNFQKSLSELTYGAAIKNVASVKILKGLRFPLPPFALQESIVSEIEAEQVLVAANRELIERMEKKIQAVIARVWGEDEPSEGMV